MCVLNRAINTLLLTALFLNGCSHAAKIADWKQTVLSPAYWNRMTTAQQTKACRREIRHALSLNDYEQAQKFMVLAQSQNTAESQLKEFYPQVINRLILAAKQSTAADAPDQAGIFYKLAKEIYPSTKQYCSALDLSMSEIDKEIKECADELMRTGLIAYRSGNLRAAIEIWSKIAPFCPEHKTSQVALDTAQQQLQNLKKLTSKNANHTDTKQN